MYTINPLPIVDTLNNHGGFWFVVLACLVVYMFVVIIMYDGFYDISRKCVGASIPFLCVVAWTGYVSWTSGEITVPLNTPVVGEFVSVFGEGESYNVRSGKSGYRRVDNHHLYVVYNIEGNQIVFRAEPGQTNPKYATFYKN